MNPSLQFGLSRVQGVSSQTYFIEPNNSTSASANQIVRFTIPENTLWHTRDTILSFNAFCEGANAGGRLPSSASLIERYTLSAGGIQLSSGANFQNVLMHAQNALMKSKEDSVLGHTEYVRRVSYVDATTITTNGPEAYPDDSQRRFAVNIGKLPGILSSIDPAILDTGLFPTLTLEVVFAGNSVLSSVAGVSLPGTTDAGGTAIATTVGRAGSRTATYKITNLRLQCSVYGLASSFYDEMVSQRIASTGFLEMRFDNYFAFSDSGSSCKAQVASQSIDKLWVVQRAANPDLQGELITVPGYKVAGGLSFATPAGAYAAPTVDLGRPQYDTGGVYDTSREKYIGKLFRFQEQRANANTPAQYQFSVQNVNVPQAPADLQEMYSISRNACGSHYCAESMTLDQYRKAYCVQCIRLNLPDSDVYREITGLDSRGVNSAILWKGTGIVSTAVVNLFAQVSSSIRLGSAKALEVIA